MTALYYTDSLLSRSAELQEASTTSELLNVMTSLCIYFPRQIIYTLLSLFFKIYLYINSFLYIYLFILFLGFHGPIILPFLLLPTTIFACPFNQDPQFLTVH